MAARIGRGALPDERREEGNARSGTTKNMRSNYSVLTPQQQRKHISITPQNPSTYRIERPAICTPVPFLIHSEPFSTKKTLHRVLQSSSEQTPSVAEALDLQQL